MSSPGKSRVVAGFVSIAGVIAIWAVSAARQNEQTEAIARRWIGEQWDVARRCLVGTPIGRSERVEMLREKLERELVWALASDAVDPAARWPVRCVPLLSSLHADRAILRADPGDALATLEVLAPRALAPDADGFLSLRDAAARARELAEPIARLDAAMPSGAEYDPSAFARPERGVPAEAVIASLACPEPDARMERLAIRRTFRWDEDTDLRLDGRALALRDIGTSEDAARLALEGSFEGIALCRAGSVRHVIAARGDRRSWIAWSGSGPARAIEMTPPPPAGAIVACSDRALMLAWREHGAWRGTRCAGDRCAATPPLAAGPELALALTGDTVLAVHRAAGSDLPLARVLGDGPAWSAPVPVARGALTVDGSAFRIEACEGAVFRSEDGLRWTPSRASAERP